MQLMSIEDLATYLGYSKRTVYKYIASGDCPPCIKISAKNIKFDRADVDAWLESKKLFSKMDKTESQYKTLPRLPRLRQVIKLAQQESKRNKLDYVGTEHQLLGILEVNDCLGAIILRNLDIEQAKVHELYEQFAKDPKTGISDKGSFKKSVSMDSATQAIGIASEEAIRMGHTYVGTEHLLVAIMFIGEGLGRRILLELGITLEQIRREMAQLIVCRPPTT